MTRKELILVFSKLGQLLNQIGSKKAFSDTQIGLNKLEYIAFESAVQSTHIHNAWFTYDNVCMAFRGLSSWLEKDNLEKWLNNYTFSSHPKKIGLIMAGNIPLVGFHDFLSVVLTGNKAVCKLSSDDTYLWKVLLKNITLIEPKIEQYFSVSEGKLGEIDAVIATGSDNSARYFEYYFGKYPHIIRKNRTSVAALTGEETEDDLAQLSNDIFNYFGLGCRNISQLLIPESFEIDRIFKSFLPHKEIINHHKYANNFDYNRAIFLMNGDDILENGFVLLKNSSALYSPLAVINYHRYKNNNELQSFLDSKKQQIQIIAGLDYLPFGSSQFPKINDYADGVNTLDFLETIH